MFKVFAFFSALLYAAAAIAQDSMVLNVDIVDRKIAVSAETLRVTEGDAVKLRWTADEAVELHLHGYEIAIQVPAGGSAVMGFTANATGRFPVTHHGFGADMGKLHGHAPMLYLEVHPK